MQNEPADINANTRDAVAVLTAWFSEGGSPTLALEQAEQILSEENGVRRLCSGLINVAGKLLIQRESEGEDPFELLQRIGLESSA